MPSCAMSRATAAASQNEARLTMSLRPFICIIYTYLGTRNHVGMPDAIEGVMEPCEPSSEAFERLLLLRRCYPRRSDYDRRSGLTVDEVIAFGERLLLLTALHDRWRRRDMQHRAA